MSYEVAKPLGVPVMDLLGRAPNEPMKRSSSKLNEQRGAEMNRSKKASSRVTTSNQEASAAAAESKTASRLKAVRSNAVENAAKRQFQKSQATAIQGHMRSSGQRRQAKRDAR